jgi:REP element-mobilizing transposase RayT
MDRRECRLRNKFTTPESSAVLRSGRNVCASNLNEGSIDIHAMSCMNNKVHELMEGRLRRRSHNDTRIGCKQNQRRKVSQEMGHTQNMDENIYASARPKLVHDAWVLIVATSARHKSRK